MNLPDFAGLAPAGYYVALRVGFAFPQDEVNAMPRSWIDHYTRHGLMLKDPLMRWAYVHHGAARWSELENGDDAGVLTAARDHGLNFGAVVSTMDMSDTAQRSFGIFARADRELTDVEIRSLGATLADLHATMTPPATLTEAEKEVLRMVRNGMIVKQIAGQLGVSHGAIKQRLRNAKDKLGARTGTHAAAQAMSFGLI